MIKTIWCPDINQFDDMVNATTREGYKLKVRDIRELAPGQRGFYAELEKQDEVDSVKAIEAMRVIMMACKNQASCNDCPLVAFLGDCPCEFGEPESWVLPEEWRV